jgi:hypothetical protein
MDFQQPIPFSALIATGWPYAFSVPQFDPSLGTLEQVTLQYQGSWSGTFSITNNSSSSDNLSGTQYENLDIYTNSYADDLANMGGNSGLQMWNGVAPGATTSPAYNWTGNSGGLQTTDITTDLGVWTGLGTNPVDVTFGGYAETSGGWTCPPIPPGRPA